MPASDPANGLSGILGSLRIAPIRIEDLPAIRYVHVTAFRSQAATCYGEAEVAAFEQAVRSPDYGQALLDDRVLGGFMGADLIGTAGWQPGLEGADTVRMRAIFVSPFFMRLGVGRHLVAAAEREAGRAGYSAFSVRATLNVVGFLQRMGYAVTSQGVRQLQPTVGLPVAFMRKSAVDQPSDPRA
ncbi:MAG: GNAT family N-acetyltransferase [Hyphomicrobiaceae bacterium]|nr:GNAT family N-acetyltransferase [Hyphomicrobiaceae bacterium]